MIFGAAAVGVAAWAWTDIDLSVEEDIFVDTVTMHSSNVKSSLKMAHFFANNVITFSSPRYIHVFLFETIYNQARGGNSNAHSAGGG